jgi:CRP-like cAMP-binding protein
MPGDLLRPSTNLLLSRLSPEDLSLIRPHLKPVDLPLRHQLERPNRPIDHVYFLESGFASVVANASSRGIEVGLIGREGMTGLPVLMGVDRSPHETFIQCAGHGSRIATGSLQKAIRQSETLHRTLLLYAHVMGLQATFTALANGRSKLEERLARWLLMAQDRIGRERISLTHEFLAIMLGVRRPGVTVALRILESLGLIRADRGTISILDRTGLERLSNGTYGGAEAEYTRLLG